MNSSKKSIFITFNLCLIHLAIATNLRRVLPTSLEIRVGEDMQLRLTSQLEQEIYCYVRTPSHQDYNLKDEEGIDSDNRISYWTENGECGFKIINISKEDEGIWRITSKNTSHTLVDAVNVGVLDELHPMEREYSILSGLGYTLALAEDTKYCAIGHPRSNDRTLVAGDCKIDVTRPTAADDGEWVASTGVIGQIQEVSKTAKLNVFKNNVNSGYKISSDAKKIDIFCNLRHYEDDLTFCRFVTPGEEQIGLQLSEGLHSGRYGYYGGGLEKGECGITIESPESSDYGQWQCILGIEGKESFGIYIPVQNDDRSTIEPRALTTTSTVITTPKQVLKLECSANVALSYCWLEGPNHERLTPSPLLDEEATYRYVGSGLSKGQCGVEIFSADETHNGQWSCHMGPEVPGIELVSIIDARIAGTPLAAKQINVTVDRVDDPVSLECRTVPNTVALEYCRFYSPDGTGIHIDERITENSPLVVDDVHYWYNGSGLQFGDCGITIDKVSSKHIGKWFCAAKLESETTNDEAFDIIEVNINAIIDNDSNKSGSENVPAIAATGIVMGVLVILGVVVVGSLFAVKRVRKHRRLISEQESRRSSGSGNSSRIEMVSIGSGESTASRNSESNLEVGADFSTIGRNTSNQN